ncbi:MAG TPA: SDR family oxidoreductase, partial [Gammaproteobacteria bacterium]|nr:SDR family oxidoreductase [Gammaproteobacteria bacterium]
MWNFTNKKALVTGASQGIGFAIARMLEKAGAEVHIFDLVENPEHGSPGIFHQLDISDPDQVREIACELPTDLSLLVNNAGITRDRSLIKMSDLEWRQVIDVNLSGAFHVIRALAPAMRELGSGHIVNIASINGLRGKFGQANYCAAKAGLIGLTKTAARELGPKGITVNAVAPGMVLTEMTKKIPEQYLQKALEETALKHLAEPEDIANTVLFLLSDAARM